MEPCWIRKGSDTRCSWNPHTEKTGPQRVKWPGHMAARSSDGTRTQGFWPLGTPAWAIWTLPWEREEEERRSLETWLVESGPDALWLMESGPDALAWIPLVVSHNLVLPRRCQPRGIHKQPLPAGLSDVCFSCLRCWLCAREGYPS